jgi:hypothetical protein
MSFNKQELVKHIMKYSRASDRLFLTYINNISIHISCIGSDFAGGLLGGTLGLDHRISGDLADGLLDGAPYLLCSTHNVVVIQNRPPPRQLTTQPG